MTAATLAPVEREEVLRALAPFETLAIECEGFQGHHVVPVFVTDLRVAARLAARLRAPIAPAPIEPGEGARVRRAIAAGLKAANLYETAEEDILTGPVLADFMRAALRAVAPPSQRPPRPQKQSFQEMKQLLSQEELMDSVTYLRHAHRNIDQVEKLKDLCRLAADEIEQLRRNGSMKS